MTRQLVESIMFVLNDHKNKVLGKKRIRQIFSSLYDVIEKSIVELKESEIYTKIGTLKTEKGNEVIVASPSQPGNQVKTKKNKAIVAFPDGPDNVRAFEIDK